MLTPRRLTLATLLLGACFSLLGGFLRPPSYVTGMPPNQFWARKLLWHHEFDVALLGDSRTFQGLSPARMTAALPGRRIANFAFGRAGLTPEYLAAAEAILDPASPRRALVLSVTPHELTPNAARENQLLTHWKQVRPWRPDRYANPFNDEYLALQMEGRSDLVLEDWLGGPLHFFRPYSWRELWTWLHNSPNGYFQVYHPDGWIASRKVPENHDAAYRWARDIFIGNLASAEIQARLMTAVRELSARGVRVYAFRMWTTPRTMAREVEFSGFRFEPFAREFVQAGGIWLELPERDYVSHDGSHLRWDSALEFSAELAKAIAATEAVSR